MLLTEDAIAIVEAPIASPRKKRWLTDEFNRFVERGALQGQRIFLFRGEILEMPAMGAMHRIATINLTHWLTSVFRPEFSIQIQLPLITGSNSVPEPDAAVIRPEEALRRPHPRSAVFVIEVSDSSLDLDLEKAFDYAAAGVPEYWILDVNSRSITILRDPQPDPSAPLGFRYMSSRIALEDESISSLVRPDSPVAVTSLLATK